MMRFFALTCLLVATASVATAQTTGMSPAGQEPYARIIKLEGAVTVFADTKASGASMNMSLNKDNSVVTSGNGKITIRFRNGCDATVEPGQTFVVDAEGCAALLARSQPPVGVQQGIDPMRNSALAAWGAALGAIVLSKNKVSGS